MTDPTLDLYHGFTQPSQTDWLAMVEASLKGRALKDFTQKTDDGLPRGPLSTKADHPENYPAYPRASVPLLEDRTWHIMAPVNDPDVAYANQQALEDLEGGASGLYIVMDPTGDNGVCVQTSAGVKRLMEGVYTSLIPISIKSRPHNMGYAALMASLPDLHSAHIQLGIDPVSKAFEAQAHPDFTGLKSVIDWCKKNAPNWQAITINAASVHEHGGTDAQALAFMAASLAAYLSELGPDFDPKIIAKHITVTLACDRDAHLGLVKFRAARRIIARILDCYDMPDMTLPIHAVSSHRMMQSQDPWTNMLRTMSAGFGAICGGADYISLDPFTVAMGLATPFGHRIARNMQILMMEEGHLGQVSDPASGSYFHDQMTEKLAETAWTEFQATERAGGIGIMCENGVLKQTIAIASKRRDADNKPIVGVTLHPAPDLRAADIRKPPKIRASSAPVMDATDFEDMIAQAKDGYQIGGAA